MATLKARELWQKLTKNKNKNKNAALLLFRLPEETQREHTAMTWRHQMTSRGPSLGGAASFRPRGFQAELVGKPSPPTLQAWMGISLLNAHSNYGRLPVFPPATASESRPRGAHQHHRQADRRCDRGRDPRHPATPLLPSCTGRVATLDTSGHSQQFWRQEGGKAVRKIPKTCGWWVGGVQPPTGLLGGGGDWPEEATQE